MTLWYSLEKDFLPYDARHHGIGGCTDADLIRYAPRLLYPYQPSCVIVQTGSNDLAAGLQPDSILKRKQDMYTRFLENLPDTHFVVCSGLPLPGRMQYWPATDRMNMLLEDMCEHHPRLVFLDATPHMLADEGKARYRTQDGRYFRPGYFRIDRIHLNKQGHDVWTALMKQTLSTLSL